MDDDLIFEIQTCDESDDEGGDGASAHGDDERFQRKQNWVCFDDLRERVKLINKES